MLTYCQLDSQEQIYVKFESMGNSLIQEMYLKYLLQNVGHFV